MCAQLIIIVILVMYWLQIDVDGNGFIRIGELGEALKSVGIKLAQYEVRDLLRKYDSKVKDDQLDMDEFEKVTAVIVIDCY